MSGRRQRVTYHTFMERAISKVLDPAQQVVKTVSAELVALLGGARGVFNNWMMCSWSRP